MHRTARLTLIALSVTFIFGSVGAAEDRSGSLVAPATSAPRLLTVSWTSPPGIQPEKADVLINEGMAQPTRVPMKMVGQHFEATIPSSHDAHITFTVEYCVSGVWHRAL